MNLSTIDWNPEPGKRSLILRALDSRGIEFTSIEKQFDIRRTDWNIGLTGIELIGTGSNQEIQITTIRENQNLLSNADCLIILTSDDYIETHLIEPSGVYLLPKIDRPPLADGSELIIQFSCAFPWDIESDSTDNQIIIILTGGGDDDDGIQDLETGLLSASLIIGLAITMAWLVKNHRERKEMMRITEEAIKQNISNKKIIMKNEVQQPIEESDEQQSSESIIDELKPTNDVVEEELDEFELRLRRLGKL
jgi:hypothetical protein